LGRDDGAGATVDVIAPAVEVIDARDTAVAV
jgi:hypothetical protein